MARGGCGLHLLLCGAPPLSFGVMQSEPPKLRWYTPSWSDPVGWARWGGNSRMHLLCAILFQLALWGMWVGCLFAFATIRTIEGVPVLSHVPLLFLLAVAFVTGVFFPAAFLYALYQLIRIIDENSRKA
jgi:hypothetical protein